MIDTTVLSSLPVSTEIVYTSTTEHPVWGVVKDFFNETLLFPYMAIHRLIGRLTCPRSYDPLDNELNVVHDQSLKAERKTIVAGNDSVDVIILRNKTMAEQKRWSIVAGGNGDGIYSALSRTELTDKLGGNAIFFDYSGLKTRQALVNAAIAMMRYVETQGAQEVVGIGVSLGGGILREAYKYHVSEKKADACYAFIFDRTFSKLKYVIIYFVQSILERLQYPTIALPAGYIAAYFASLFGWNLGSLSVSKKIDFEIALQDQGDEIIHEQAWLCKKNDSRALITEGLGHNYCPTDYIDQLVTRVNTHFTSKV